MTKLILSLVTTLKLKKELKVCRRPNLLINFMFLLTSTLVCPDGVPDAPWETIGRCVSLYLPSLLPCCVVPSVSLLVPFTTVRGEKVSLTYLDPAITVILSRPDKKKNLFYKISTYFTCGIVHSQETREVLWKKFQMGTSSSPRGVGPPFSTRGRRLLPFRDRVS